jgi:carbon-monoxide dehydrogenase large subunit
LICSGLQSNGQGHATVFPRLVAERLGVDIANVVLGVGDSRLVPDGAGSVGSRSMTIGGAACAQAADALISRACVVAAEMMQVPVAQVDYRAGRVTCASTGQSISLADIVSQGQALSVLERARAEMTYPNGCHVAEVEIEPETGEVQVVSFVAVDDVGRCIDPTLVAGQVHGGIAQGLGQVLVEFATFDENNGQLVTGSFMDYGMPRAHILPRYITEHLELPCQTNALGTKGAGEAGTTGALAAGYNAVMDALSQADVVEFDMPATPPRIWQALRAAKQNGERVGRGDREDSASFVNGS